MNTTATATARIFSGDHPALDILSALPSVEIEGAKLKPGMVLLDPDLLTPVMSLDKRVTAPRGSGDISFLAWDMETKRYDTVTVARRAKIVVAAK